MKKLLVITFIMFITALTACTSYKTNKEQVLVKSLNENKEEIEVSVNLNPERVVVLDMVSLDIIDYLEKGDTVKGLPKITVDYLKDYETKNLINTGTIKEPNIEKIIEADPEIIFIGGRMATFYKELSKIAPTVYLSIDENLGIFEGTRSLVKTISKIYGLENNVDDIFSNYKNEIDMINNQYNMKSALVTMVSGTSLSVLTNSGKGSLIGKEFGFNNIGNNKNDSTHGDQINFEFLVKQNPEYIFVLDRNQVTGDNYNPRDIVENDVTKQTDAYKNNKIIYLKNSNVWYSAEGGIKALEIMINDIKNM